MDVKLHPDLADSILAREAATAIEACVHCGFCLATCPTYLDSRDERDSPRGRIYLIKELLETGDSSRTAQHHLDRCLTCRSCETTCPSAVRYGDIADAGRALLEETVARSARERLARWLLRAIVPRRRRFAFLLAVGQTLRPLLPRQLGDSVPPRQKPLATAPTHGKHERRVILLEGCVQGAATPLSNQCVRAILDDLGIGVAATPAQGCCGALNTHLAAVEDGKDDMRRNIDAWWPAIEAGAEAIISAASGCSSQLKDYAKALARDPAYAERAARVSVLAQDFAPYLQRLTAATPPVRQDRLAGIRVAVHVPCSQSHALGEPDTVRQLLQARGYRIVRTRDDHLCCGSAGSYSLLQPAMSQRLRAAKLNALDADAPDVIVSANIGCQLHLAQGSDIPVKHWVELYLDSISEKRDDRGVRQKM
jgi:glycolate oxidase iron-sulfur subunit